MPVSIGATVLIVRRSQRQFVAQWASTGALNGHVEETHTGHAIVKAFGRQREAIERFEEENDRLYEASRKAQFISGTIQPVLTFVSNVNYVAIAVFGGLQVASGAMSLGDVVAFIQYSRQFTFPIIQLASVVNVLQSAVASAERVFELLDEAEESLDPADAPAFLEPVGSVAFEDVSFRYEPDKPLIDDLNLNVESGRTVAIVGPTGAGKTTLVNLLMRFYELDGGRITVDGIDTRDLRRDSLRQAFGMVLQDTWLFHGTIRENIAYGRIGATDEEVHAATEAAHVDHFVKTLPDGYDTVIDDDATNLSAGEKQLLTIARAFLADPPILILDEATSSVDTRTEVLIQRAMAGLMKGRTTFVIAHRLSTIRDAAHDPRDGQGRDRRAGQPRGAARGARFLLRPLQQPVRGGARRGELEPQASGGPVSGPIATQHRPGRVSSRASRPASPDDVYDAVDEREVHPADQRSVLVDERVERAVAESDVAVLVGERLVAAVAQRRHHRASPAGVAARAPARDRRASSRPPPRPRGPRDLAPRADRRGRRRRGRASRRRAAPRSRSGAPGA